MTRLIAIAAALVLLGACAHGDDEKGLDHLVEGGHFSPPSGAIAAPILSPEECASDPACVCTLPPDLRPETILVPQIVRQINPDAPEEIDVDCSEVP